MQNTLNNSISAHTAESASVNKILANVQGYYSGDYDWNDFYGDDDDFSVDEDDDMKLDSNAILTSNSNKFDSIIQDKLKVFQNKGSTDNSNLGDVRFRQRIRNRRMRHKANEDDNPDFFHDEIEQIQRGEEIAALSPEEMNEIRSTAWIPKGEYIPEDIIMGYHTAWDIGKRGCVAVKLVGNWDSHISPNKVRFFIMDGTDPIAFLSYYTKSDLKVSRGEKSEKKGIIFAKDLRDGYWDYGRSKIIFTRRNKSGQTTIIENLPTQFMDAMMVCIREIEVHKKVTKIIKERRKQANNNTLDKNPAKTNVNSGISNPDDQNSNLLKTDVSKNDLVPDKHDFIEDAEVAVPLGNALTGKRASITKLVAPKIDFEKLKI
ncbi:hypothetical protein CmeUKMEL1_11180 [Cryptosporidium meleagridis]|uniref:Uncharacterized protein n=1 Tax=Cryptosporidium meleagridis TaxID=93969 RepID=A0A2P4Z299_9CRYT|nr:hypothetical protein CmeUKMEL1_11180 [Cryptosporidium meleagridis]